MAIDLLTRPVLLLVATRPEAEPIAKALQIILRPARAVSFQGPGWRLVQTGMGGQRMVEALGKAIADGPVSRVIHFGYTGGLDPAVVPGQVLRPMILMETTGDLIALDQPVPRTLAASHAVPQGPMLLSVHQVIHQVETKRALFDAHGCQMVDMESYAVAKACAAMNLPYVSLRAVSDPHDMALPAGSAQWLDEEGHLVMSRITRYVLTHPNWGPKLAKLGQHAGRAGKALAAAVFEELQRETDECPENQKGREAGQS